MKSDNFTNANDLCEGMHGFCVVDSKIQITYLVFPMKNIHRLKNTYNFSFIPGTKKPKQNNKKTQTKKTP